MERLITKAVFATFGGRLALDELDDVVEAFEDGLIVETGERTASREYVRWLHEIPGLPSAVRQLGIVEGAGVSDGNDASDPAVIASAVEFILEGLHLSRRINKDRAASGSVYRR